MKGGREDGDRQLGMVAAVVEVEVRGERRVAKSVALRSEPCPRGMGKN